jgi:hypothetical protein
MSALIKLLIPFDTLVEAIAVLERDDQIKLRHILDQHISQTDKDREADKDIEAFLAERGCQIPLKAGLTLTSEPDSSGQTNISIDHDQVAIQKFESEH